jgi:hypothetical protein
MGLRFSDIIDIYFNEEEIWKSSLQRPKWNTLWIK